MAKPEYVPPGYDPITDELPPMGPSCMTYIIGAVVFVCVALFVIGGVASFSRRNATEIAPTVAALATETATEIVSTTPEILSTETPTDVVVAVTSETAAPMVSASELPPLPLPDVQSLISPTPPLVVTFDPTYYPQLMENHLATLTATLWTSTPRPTNTAAPRRPSRGGTSSGSGGSGGNGSGISSGGNPPAGQPINPTPMIIWITVWPEPIPATLAPTLTPTLYSICWSVSGSAEPICVTTTPGVVNGVSATPTIGWNTETPTIDPYSTYGTGTSTYTASDQSAGTTTYLPSPTATPTSTGTPTHTATYTPTYTETPTPTATETWTVIP
jgi:hypothetical protein